MLKKLAVNAKTFAKKQYDIKQLIKKWNDLFEKSMKLNKREHVWNLTRSVTLSPAELYAESLGEYGAPLIHYIHAGISSERLACMNEIKRLFDSNPMFFQKTREVSCSICNFFLVIKYYRSGRKSLSNRQSCDFYGAYRKFQRLTEALLQFCWAHFIREVLFLLGLKEAAVRRYGKRIRKQIVAMFETIHRKGDMEEKEWKRLMRGHQELIVKRATATVPEQKEAQLIAKRVSISDL